MLAGPLMIDTTTMALAALLGVVGLVIGSFVNLVAMRLPKDEPIAMARSRADCCGQPLRPIELIPVLSWLAQRGRCRRCGEAVSARHPLVELTGAAIGVWAALASASPMHAALTALLGWQLLLIALVDADALWMPDRLTLPLAATGLGAAALLSQTTVLAAMVGAVAGFVLLWLVREVYRRLRGREGLGGGDPFLFGAVGAWVSWIGLPSVLLWACAAGLSWVASRALLRRPLAADEPLPFGPFIAIGAWLTWVLGPIGLG